MTIHRSKPGKTCRSSKVSRMPSGKEGRWRTTTRVCLVTVGLLGSLSPAKAQTTVFNGTVDSDWQTAGNWSAGIPTSASVAEISGADAVLGSGSTATADVVDVQGNRTLTVEGASTLNLARTSVGASSSGSMVVSGAGTSVVNTGVSGGPIDVAIGSGAGVTGTLTISSGALFAGPATIGEFLLGNSGGTGNVVLTNGGTLAAGSIGVASGTGSITINSGTFRALVATTDVFPSFSSGQFVINAGGGTIDTNGFDITATNVISGAGGPSKSGTGVLTLSGGNSYSGATTVSAGTLTAADDTALGTTGSGTTVSAGATLALTGTITTGEPVTLNGDGVAGGGALRNPSGDNSLIGPITLASASRINSDSQTLILSGGLSGAGQNLTLGGAGDIFVSSNIATGTGTLTKDGTGVIGLSGSNTFTGDLSVTNGTLQLSGGSAVADSVLVQVNSGAILQVANTETVGTIAGAGGIILGGGFVPVTLTVGDGSDSTFSGPISDIGSDVGSLTKQGAGVLTLTGTSSYSGITTVQAGTLLVNGSIASDATIANSGTLGGSGTAAGITLQSGGVLAPGASLGSLSASSLQWAGGGQLAFDLSTNTSDFLSLSGALLKTGSGSYEFLFSGTATPGFTYDLIGFGSTDFDAADFSIANSGFTSGTFVFNGSTLQFIAVPEPSVMFQLAFALLATAATKMVSGANGTKSAARAKRCQKRMALSCGDERVD